MLDMNEMDSSKMDLVEVTARFGIDGSITPYSFSWKGSNYSVVSVGRNWRDDFGKHILVMVAGDRVFELIFNPGEFVWYLRRLDGGRMAA